MTRFVSQSRCRAALIALAVGLLFTGTSSAAGNPFAGRYCGLLGDLWADVSIAPTGRVTGTLSAGFESGQVAGKVTATGTMTGTFTHGPIRTKVRFTAMVDLDADGNLIGFWQFEGGDPIPFTWAPCE